MRIDRQTRWPVRFSKWHALGNSYLLVEREDAGLLTADRARRLCDVSLGIGADGVLEVVAVDGARADVIIWNPDGSRAEMSGNGTRIAAAWLARRVGKVEVAVTVAGREVIGRTLAGGDVETEMGRVEVGAPETLQLEEGPVELTTASVGNPHAVVFPDGGLTRRALLEIGGQLERHPRFPERTNVQLAFVEGRHDVRALVWERGAGETSASGSSAVAVAAVAIARGFCDSPVRVRMPGGDLLVHIDADHATLIGPAEEICDGETDL
jgi:diaminopimelate epimerase